MEDPEQWLEDCPDRVYEQWYAAHRLRPWGDEQELLSRIVSLLYLVAARDGWKFDDVCKASDSLMPTIMPVDWMNNRSTEQPKLQIDFESIAKAQQAIAKAFS